MSGVSVYGESTRREQDQGVGMDIEHVGERAGAIGEGYGI